MTLRLCGFGAPKDIDQCKTQCAEKRHQPSEGKNQCVLCFDLTYLPGSPDLQGRNHDDVDNEELSQEGGVDIHVTFLLITTNDCYASLAQRS